MKENTKYLIQEKAIGIHNKGINKAYLLSVINELGDISKLEINYNIAKKLNIDNIYMSYSVDLKAPCKKNFAKPYKIINKIIDEKNNIILTAKKLEYIDLKND